MTKRAPVPGSIECEGWPDCEGCTPEEPGPVSTPVIIGGMPGEQLLAELQAHNPQEEP